jgi:hypothetical protein
MWQGRSATSCRTGCSATTAATSPAPRAAVYRPEDAQIGEPRQRARRDRRRRHDRARLVAHRQQPRAHRCRDRGPARVRASAAVYGYSAGAPGPANRFPDDIRRLRKEHFASTIQLLTLAMAAGGNPAHWALAREVGAIISVHVVGSDRSGRRCLGPDVTCIHCTNLTPEAWRRLADTVRTCRLRVRSRCR